MLLSHIPTSSHTSNIKYAGMDTILFENDFLGGSRTFGSSLIGPAMDYSRKHSKPHSIACVLAVSVLDDTYDVYVQHRV